MLRFFKKLLQVDSIKQFYSTYERHIGAASIAVGFIFDNLTLRDASISAQTTVFTIYLVLSGVSILLLHYIEAKKDDVKYRRIHFWTFLLLQFAIGSIFSMFFVFYSRGVSIAASWPFLLLLVATMVSTEMYKKHYMRLSLQVSLFFIAIFSFCIYFVPVVTREMSMRIFFLSGILALISIGAFVHVLTLISADRVRQWRGRILAGVSIVFVLMNVFYLTGVIPPVPLVMRAGGVYHSLAWDNVSSYIVRGEEKSWWNFLVAFPTYHHAPSDPVYIMTAVYAPTALRTTIVHDWQYYDESTYTWKSMAKIRVPIVGGREGGYRTYSMKQNLIAGKWRVDIKTAEGQVVGRIRFSIVDSDVTPDLVEETY